MQDGGAKFMGVASNRLTSFTMLEKGIYMLIVPVMPAPPDEEANIEVQVAQISSMPNTIKDLLQAEPETTEINCSDLISDEQLKDQELVPIIIYLKDGTLPEDVKLAKKMVAEATLYAIHNDILYYVGPRQTETSRVVVPQRLRKDMMQNYQTISLYMCISNNRR